MRNCAECGDAKYEELILPEHIEDLGGITVRLINAVHVRRCPKCEDEHVMIPDMSGLIRAVAVHRAFIPVALCGAEVKFFRRALDMNQQEFAAAMDLSAETVSRWENDARGVGQTSDKLVRHNMCALLADKDEHISYDPSGLARLRLRQPRDGEQPPMIDVERVRLKIDNRREDAWGALCDAA